MAASSSREDLENQLLDIVRSMEQEGMIDFHFRIVRGMKETNGPFFFASLLPTFCRDSTETLRELTAALYVVFLRFYGCNCAVGIFFDLLLTVVDLWCILSCRGQTVLNYHDLVELSIKIRGSASCIGACRMADACNEVQRAAERGEDKESLLTALNAAKQVFSALQEKMGTLLQLEKRIISHDTADLDRPFFPYNSISNHKYTSLPPLFLSLSLAVSRALLWLSSTLPYPFKIRI
ncbi:hypothetical protein V6N13_121095 [Hibiscus sabdariffa]